jgi:hypothetical protein
MVKRTHAAEPHRSQNHEKHASVLGNSDDCREGRKEKTKCKRSKLQQTKSPQDDSYEQHSPVLEYINSVPRHDELSDNKNISAVESLDKTLHRNINAVESLSRILHDNISGAVVLTRTFRRVEGNLKFIWQTLKNASQESNLQEKVVWEFAISILEKVIEDIQLDCKEDSGEIHQT